MRLRVSDPAALPGLLEFLERRGAVVVQVSDDEIDSTLLRSYPNRERMRLDLCLLLRAWGAGRSHGTVEILD
jgi:hypothetical protein